MRHGLRALSVVALLIAAALAGCNGVLGIEEAELMEGAGASSAAPAQIREVPVSTCDRPAPGCESCVTMNCATDYAAALATVQGRTVLNSYRACLGTNCADEGGLCLEAVSQAEPLFGLCVRQNCGSACANSSLASTLKLYCECMTRKCTNAVATDLLGACEANASTDLAELACERTHCEYAEPNDGHCDHAVGVGDFCSGVSECDTAGSKGWICRIDTECCSGDCQAPSGAFCN